MHFHLVYNSSYSFTKSLIEGKQDLIISCPLFHIPELNDQLVLQLIMVIQHVSLLIRQYNSLVHVLIYFLHVFEPIFIIIFQKIIKHYTLFYLHIYYFSTFKLLFFHISSFFTGCRFPFD